MRMSCDGCRVLRKGCSENCTIRPCLQWIKSPEAQANATVFLAKFYGRAGLMNLINAGPDNLRPAIFRSLLYEACGRIVNPIYGSVGLLWSGSWQLCQAAVEAVLKGAPIVQIPSDAVASTPVPPFKAYDIRHVSKGPEQAPADHLHKVSKPRTRFKRCAAAKPKPLPTSTPDPERLCNLSREQRVPVHREHSHESSANHSFEMEQVAEQFPGVEDRESRENESAFSVETSSHVSQGEPNEKSNGAAEVEEEEDMGLELTLGFEPAARAGSRRSSAEPRRCDVTGWGDDTCRVDLGLQLPA